MRAAFLTEFITGGVTGRVLSVQNRLWTLLGKGSLVGPFERVVIPRKELPLYGVPRRICTLVDTGNPWESKGGLARRLPRSCASDW